MKKLSLLVAALSLASSTFAATLGDPFDVSVTFTSSCSVSTAAADMAFTYTAFGPVQNAATSTVFTCSRGLTPTFSFDNAAGQTGSAATGVAAAALTAEGVIKGLRYTLTSAVPAVSAGTAASAGAGGTGGSNGTADTYTLNIAAQIPAGQAGDPTGVNVQTRTLTITY